MDLLAHTYALPWRAVDINRSVRVVQWMIDHTNRCPLQEFAKVFYFSSMSMEGPNARVPFLLMYFPNIAFWKSYQAYGSLTPRPHPYPLPLTPACLSAHSPKSCARARVRWCIVCPLLCVAPFSIASSTFASSAYVCSQMHPPPTPRAHRLDCE